MERLSETDRDASSDTRNPIKAGANENPNDWMGIDCGAAVFIVCVLKNRMSDPGFVSVDFFNLEFVLLFAFVIIFSFPQRKNVIYWFY